MAAPDAGTYIEFMAPDLRFAMLLALMAITAVFAIKRKSVKGFSPTWRMIAFAWLAFVPWLATNGNGRYFMPVLLLVGPLCVALIHKLPLTGSFRVSAVIILIAVQAVALLGASPWGRWPLAPWGKPYFDLTLTEEERSSPAAYVTVTSISYSLIAPLFDPRSRWINIASLPPFPDKAMDVARAQAFLQRAVRDKLPLKLIVPTAPLYMQADGQPTDPMRNELNRLVGNQALGLAVGQTCKIARSRTIAALAMGDLDDARKKEKIGLHGFWICNLAYPALPPPKTPDAPEDSRAALVFNKIERDCPRIFRPGEGASSKLPGGFVRSYPSTDIKAYVLDSGDVMYKYWRGLNPGRIGTVTQVLTEGFRMDCDSIRGRSGLPWERQI